SSSYADIKSTIDKLTATWREFSPDFPIQYYFLDQALAREYRSEDQFETAFFWFSLFAIFIACLGLFGLTAYTVEQRTKEISVRKILGATTTGITFMLSRQFIALVLFSNIIAWPVAYYVANNWLQNFAYRINISPLVFLLSGAMALVIALVTVSSHAIKAATANPIENLRYE
ncbi:MAG: FtsX-like permease family protein, partial [Bacteroidetes bacterium]|nr:FtsX-like permease family protein [Bacteroidota bacterium]